MPLRRTRLRRRRKGHHGTVAGRPNLSPGAWRERVATLTRRCGRRCENPMCRDRGPLDPHHVQKRSQGGSDEGDNIVMLCRATCHPATDLPHDHPKRLEVQTHGGEEFSFGQFRPVDNPACEPAFATVTWSLWWVRYRRPA